jgi:hypothetical protein
MFSHAFRRTVLGAAVAVMLLVPAAQADDWARDSQAGLDPAIATAVAASVMSEEVALDPAIRTALHQAPVSSSTNGTFDRPSPDTRDAALRAHAQTAVASPGPLSAGRFDWGEFGLGIGVAFGSMLLLTGLAAGALATRQRHGVNTGPATT